MESEKETRIELHNDKTPGKASAQTVKSNSVTRMGEAPIGKLLLEMSWPAVLSMTINAVYNLVDSMFVSRISESALTAVSYAMPIQMIMIAVSIGSSVGVNSLIARRLGARRYEEADQAASTSIRIGIINAFLFFLMGLLVAGPFIAISTKSLTENADVIRNYTLSYLRIVCMLNIFNALDLQLEKVLQSTGNMKAPMLISLTGAITNIILDPIFIFGLIGMPRLEVAGAAIATVIGQGVALIVAIYIFRHKKQDVHIKLRGFKIDWKVVKDIYAVGLPSILMQSLVSVMNIGFNMILSVSATAVAVLGVYFKLQSFVFMPIFGMNQGAMPIMGFNYGARNKKRLMHTYKLGVVVAACIMTAGFLVFQLLPDRLLGIFNAQQQMLEMGVPALRTISLCFIPAAFGIMTGTLFQATGHGVYSLMTSLIRQLFCILPAAYILFRIGGVTASWYAFPIAEVVGIIYSVIMLRHLYKTDIKNL